MATSTISARTRKAMRLVQKKHFQRAKTARADFEQNQRNIALLERLSRRKDLSVEEFYRLMPRKFIAEASEAYKKIKEADSLFDRVKCGDTEIKVLKPAPLGALPQAMRAARTENIAGYVPVRMGGFILLTKDPKAILMNFMLTDYLEGLKIGTSRTWRHNLNKALGNKMRSYSKETLPRERFTRDMMNNFHLYFANYSTEPHYLNKQLGKYGVTIEALRKRYPNLVARAEKTTKERSSGYFTKKDMDDYYKLYKILRSCGISNSKLFA